MRESKVLVVVLSRELTALKLGCSGFQFPGAIGFGQSQGLKRPMGAEWLSCWEGQATECALVLWTWVEPRDPWT